MILVNTINFDMPFTPYDPNSNTQATTQPNPSPSISPSISPSVSPSPSTTSPAAPSKDSVSSGFAPYIPPTSNSTPNNQPVKSSGGIFSTLGKLYQNSGKELSGDLSKAWNAGRGFVSDISSGESAAGQQMRKDTINAANVDGSKEQVLSGTDMAADTADSLMVPINSFLKNTGISGAVGGEVQNMKNVVSPVVDAVKSIPGVAHGLDLLKNNATDDFAAFTKSHPNYARIADNISRVGNAAMTLEGGGIATENAPNIANTAGDMVDTAKNIINKTSSATGDAVESITNKVGEMMPKPSTPEEDLAKSADTYRQVLNLGKAQAKIEQKAALGGQGAVDLPTEMAREQLPILRDSNGKIDTTQARQIIQDRMSNISDEHLSGIINSDQTEWHSLDEAVAKTKEQVAAGSGTATYKKQVMAQLDQHLADEKELAGLKTDESMKMTGENTQKMKRSLQSEANYDRTAPQASNDAKTKLASTLRQNLENHYLDKADLGAINKQTQKYIMMDNALKSVHGQVVRGGALGKMINQGIGTIAGAATGIPIIGPLAGREIAGRLTDYALDPERLTSQASARVAKAGIENGEQTAARLASKTK